MREKDTSQLAALLYVQLIYIYGETVSR